MFLTYQVTKERTRYSYQAKQKSCFARRKVKLRLHGFWQERCNSWDSKILQAGTKCDEYKWQSWKHKFSCFGKIFQLGVASFFSSFFCYFVFFYLEKNTRHFLYEPLICSKEICWLCNAFEHIPWNTSRYPMKSRWTWPGLSIASSSLPCETTQRQNDCACSAHFRAWVRACANGHLEGEKEASFPSNFKSSMDENKFYYL